MADVGLLGQELREAFPSEALLGLEDGDVLGRIALILQPLRKVDASRPCKPPKLCKRDAVERIAFCTWYPLGAMHGVLPRVPRASSWRSCEYV